MRFETTGSLRHRRLYLSTCLGYTQLSLGAKAQEVTICLTIACGDIRSKEEWLRLSHEVPQGSSLSPLLFLINADDTGSSLRQGRLVLYADDTTLCINANCNSELEMMTFLELNNVLQHFNNVNLKLIHQNNLSFNFVSVKPPQIIVHRGC